MARYLAYGSLIDSDVSLPELAEHVGNGQTPVCTFRLLPPLTGSISEYNWFHQWRLDDGTSWFSCAKHDDKYILRFPGWADFFISTGGTVVDCAPWPDVPEETVRHLFLDQIFPRVLSQREGVVLHGASVVIDEGAVVFMGESGEGKSTLAVSFSHAGFPMLTDDGLYVTEREGRLICFPSYPGVRLWSESLNALYEGLPQLSPLAHYTEKQRLDAARGSLRFANTPVALRQIYLLESDEHSSAEKVEIKPLAGYKAFREIAKGLHRFDVTNREELLHQFDFVGKIAVAAPPHRLTFPREYGLLPDVQNAILNHLKANQRQLEESSV